MNNNTKTVNLKNYFNLRRLKMITMFLILAAFTSIFIIPKPKITPDLLNKASASLNMAKKYSKATAYSFWE